jgi:hypothetical protein
MAIMGRNRLSDLSVINIENDAKYILKLFWNNFQKKVDSWNNKYILYSRINLYFMHRKNCPF